MLVVVFGAGASKDSAPARHKQRLDRNRPWQPPLASELFQARDESFGPVMQQFGSGAALFMRLAEAVERGVPVERAIQAASDEISSTRLGLVQLAALRFYLQEITWRAGEIWSEAAFGQTNYVRFVDKIERWRAERSEAVTYVTFNYDLMIEDALSRFVIFDTFGSYIAGSTRLIKAHGSVDWGHVTKEPATLFAGGDHRQRLIREAPDRLTTANGWFRYLNWDQSQPIHSNDQHQLLYPAMALPTTGKAGFECPGEHTDALGHAIQEMDRLIVIGWRGQEEHFLAALAKSPREVGAHVVTSKPDSAAELAARLKARVPGLAPTSFGVGFSSYVADDSADSLLAWDDRVLRDLYPDTI